MKQLVKGIVFAAAALMLMQAPQAQAKVKVKKVTVKSNYGSSVHVAVGKKVKLTTTVKVSPNKSANKKVSYKSSNKKIATVSSSGYVKGIKTGKCKITGFPEADGFGLCCCGYCRCPCRSRDNIRTLLIGKSGGIDSFA